MLTKITEKIVRSLFSSTLILLIDNDSEEGMAKACGCCNDNVI